MKHHCIFLLFLLMSATIFGQRPFDLEEIRKAVSDSSPSNYSYNSLLTHFNQNPAMLDIGKGSVLYYGRLFSKNYKPYNLNFGEMDFTEVIRRRKYKQALPKGEDLLKEDPVNLEILSKLLICYKELELKDKADLTKAKLDLLIASILAYGTGQSKDNSLKVVSIGDEYSVMGMLGISGINRSSMFTGKSTLDTWKAKDPTGKRIDYYVEVLINL